MMSSKGDMMDLDRLEERKQDDDDQGAQGREQHNEDYGSLYRCYECNGQGHYARDCPSNDKDQRWFWSRGGAISKS